MEDSDTQFIYMQARYYDADVGRFVSVDPQAPKPGSIFFLNRFAYANNAPSRFVDEHGDKPGDRFATADQAAYDALRYINGRSIETNHEYAGWIVFKEGAFVATEPTQFTETRSNPVPPDVPVYGDYHTHGDYSIQNADGTIAVTGDSSRDSFNSDNFSKPDISRYDSLAKSFAHYRGYLATPGGKYLAYDGTLKVAVNLADMVRQIQDQQRQREDQPPQPQDPDNDRRHHDDSNMP